MIWLIEKHLVYAASLWTVACKVGRYRSAGRNNHPLDSNNSSISPEP